MQIIKTEKLSLNFEEKEILDRTIDMMNTILNQADNSDLLDYASAVYDNLVEMLDEYAGEV